MKEQGSYLDLRDLQVFRDLQDLRDLRVFQVLRDLRDLRDLRVFQVLRDLRVFQVLRDLQNLHYDVVFYHPRLPDGVCLKKKIIVTQIGFRLRWEHTHLPVAATTTTALWWHAHSHHPLVRG